MRKTGVFALMFAAVSATNLQVIVDKVNSAEGVHWKAELPKRFKNSEEAKKLCGTWLRDHPLYERLPTKTVQVVDALPTDFDARTQWSNCSVINVVRDQSSCGSCWAFGSTESFEDRQCIQKGRDVLMSPEDTVSCCHGITCGLSMGCNGGQPGAALKWMVNTGVVTGQDYPQVNASTSCRPYTLPPCAHHVDPTPQYPACPSTEYATPKCVERCNTGYSNAYNADKTKGSNAYAVDGVQQIQTELMNGPLAVAFTVYEDFLSYKSGVYHHTTGSALGGHAVEMIGWGVENGVDYWICKNSWNPTWGDNGFFKIRKGNNECGIEGDVNGVSFN